MFNLGPMEMMLVAGIALLLFGKNLPKVARDIGKSITEFKRGINQIEDEVHHASYSQPESSNASRPAPPEDKPETTAPKFEPPTSPPEPLQNA